MKGVWPVQYLDNPNPNQPIEKIWDTLDAFSFEEIYTQGEPFEKKANLTVCIPPVKFGPIFIKGFAYSQVSEYLIKKVPNIKRLFHICGNAMTFSYAWSEGVDCLFTLFKNKKRENYYKKKYPHRRDLIYLPLQDADWTNERFMAPFSVPLPKVIDVFCLSTAYPVKNLPMLAKMLLAYEKKYQHRLHFVLGIGAHSHKLQKDGRIDISSLSDYEKGVFQKVDEILGGQIFSYIQLVPTIPYAELTKYFSMSKCAVLASICEGKNRFIHEAMSANTPIVIFKDYNKFIRGTSPAIYPKAGEYAKEFTPESLAETIHKVLVNQHKYTPRKSYLEHNGRTHFIKTVVEHMPYYQKQVPGLKDNDLVHNKFFNYLMKFNYGITLEEFIYDKEPMLMGATGRDSILEVLKGYMGQFKIPWVDVADRDIHLFENR